METTTEASPTNRELTATEIKIAIAQIEDRLIRVAKAQTELLSKEKADSEDTALEDNEENCRRTVLRKKYEIPTGVHLFSGFESAMTTSGTSQCKQHINAFVRGKMTDNQFSDLYFFFEEFAECDYGWVLIEKPMFNYKGINGWTETIKEDHIDSIVVELKSIATRSKSKAGKLPHLSEYWCCE